MRTGTVSYKLEDLRKGVIIPIGMVGENDFTRVIFDAEEVFKKHPDAQVTMKVQPPKGGIYPATVTRDGNAVIWQVKAADVAHKGSGELQLTFTADTMVEKSYIARTDIKRSLVGNGPAPDPVQDWLDEAQGALEGIESAEVHQPIIGNDGYWYTWNQETGEYEKTDTKAQGTDGQPGQDGAPGRDGTDATPDLITKDYADLTFPVAEGTYCYHSGMLYYAKQDIQTSEAWTAAHWQQTTVEEQQRLLLNAIQGKPEIKTTDAEDVDLDITDQNGYVLARFAGGNVQTKNFDSRAIPNVYPTTEIGSPFDIADGNGNVVMRLEDGHVETKFFDGSVVPAFNEYLFSDSDLSISFGYNNTHDAVVVFNVGRANDLFDFSAFKLKPKGKRLDKCGSSDFTTVWQSATDMHSPFQINATQNADGYYSSSTDAGYTGGNHLVDIGGTNVKCASSEYVLYFADGKPVSSGYGCFINFEIKWANNIQAYNCVKADGTGRTSLVEYHDMIFDGIRFNEEIMLVPQEEIKIELWHGLQSVGWNVVYDKARFIDATNREMFTPSDSEIKSGNNVTSGIIQEGNGHGLEMRVDITCDLGKRTFYTGTSGAFLTNDIHKGYFYIINNDPTGYTLDEDDAYYLRGSYRFYPVAE